jgi:hypothetical protein
MIRCRKDGTALLVPVRAQPRAARSAVLGEHAGALKVAVTQPPEGGRANAAIAGTLARALGLRKSAVTLVRGHTSRDKTFRIEGVTAQQVNELIA